MQADMALNTGISELPELSYSTDDDDEIGRWPLPGLTG